MLEALRRGAQTWVAKLLFGILVASFAIWGIGGVFKNYGRGSIAKIGATDISADEFQRAFQSEIDKFSRDAKKRITPDQARALGLDRRVLRQMIGGAAIESHAKNLGLAISDKTLVDGIANDPDFKGPDGKFTKQGFDELLRRIGMSEQGFLQLRRKDELRAQVLGALVKGLSVPAPLLEIMHAYNQEKRVIEWVTIDADKAVTVGDPDDAKLKDLYEAGKAKYMTPEYRKFAVLQLTLSSLKSQTEVKDDEIAKAYEDSKESYNTPEQRRIQQIAFKDKAMAEAAKKALDDGSKSFGDVAKEAGAKDTDVDLGLVNKKALIDQKIADVAFALAKDKFSDVVQGRFATVLLRVTQIEPGVTRTLNDVKDQVKDKIAAEKARTGLSKKRDEVDDLRNAGKTLKEIADTLKLPFAEVAAADHQGLSPEGKPVLETPDLPKIVSQAFAPDQGGDQEGIELADGGSAWINRLAIEAPKQRPLEEVKEQVKAAFLTSERSRLVSELATKLAERVNGGEAMAAIEAAAFGKAEKTDPITRSSIPQGLGEAAVAQAFVLQKGRAGSAESPNRSSRTIVRVAEVTPAVPATKEQLDKLARDAEGELANQQLIEYTTALQDRLGLRMNEDEMKRALGGGTADQ